MWCDQGPWADYTRPGQTCLPEPGPNAPSCPQNPGVIARGSACPQGGLECSYGQGSYCSCNAADSGAAQPGWYCVPETGCPDTRPRLGASCATFPGSYVCTYEVCAFGVQCTGGVWQGAYFGC